MPLRSPFRRFRGPTVPLVRLNGLVGSRGRMPGGSSFTAAGLAPVLEGAFRIRGAKAVALSINCPGGSPVQCELLSAQIRHLADHHEVPVCAFIEDLAASGGYWLACAADEIFASSSSVVGSIGAINASFGFQDALARIGVERRVHATGPHKGMLDPFRPERPEDVAVLERVLGDIHGEFVAMVKRRRGDRLADDGDVFSAAVWSGRRALELGLIDGIGDAGTVLRERFGDEVNIRDMTPRRGWFRLRPWAAPPSAWADEILGMVEERLLFARYGL